MINRTEQCEWEVRETPAKHRLAASFFDLGRSPVFKLHYFPRSKNRILSHEFPSPYFCTGFSFVNIRKRSRSRKFVIVQQVKNTEQGNLVKNYPIGKIGKRLVCRGWQSLDKRCTIVSLWRQGVANRTVKSVLLTTPCLHSLEPHQTLETWEE